MAPLLLTYVSMLAKTLVVDRDALECFTGVCSVLLHFTCGHCFRLHPQAFPCEQRPIHHTICA